MKRHYNSGDIIEVNLETHIQIREKEYNKHIVLSDFFLDRLKMFKEEMTRRNIPFNFTIGDGGLYSKIFIDKISVRFDDIIVCTTNNRYSENKFGIFFNSLSENKYSIYSMNTDDKFTFVEIDKNSKHIEDIQNYKYEVKLSVDDYNFEVTNEDDVINIFSLDCDDWGSLDYEGVDDLDLVDGFDDDDGVWDGFDWWWRYLKYILITMENYSEETINYIISYIRKYVCKVDHLKKHLKIRSNVEKSEMYINYMIYVDNHGVLRLDVKTIRKIKLKDFLT